MRSVIGDILPLALGVAISPMPIIAVILMLLTPRAGPTSSGFLLGWVAGIVVAPTVVTVIAQAVGLSGTGGGSTASAIVKLVLGGLMLLLAVKQWRSRPSHGVDPEPPKWLSALDSVTPGKAVGLGFALSAINPKNLLMIIGTGTAIGAAKLPVGQIVVVIAIFTVIAASTVAAPVLVHRLERARAEEWLTSMKTWLTANNATVMMTLFAVIGVVLIGKGIGGL
ncbi:MAG TPA: GAP family protein [Micromonosporaceae bacterium]